MGNPFPDAATAARASLAYETPLRGFFAEKFPH